MGKKSKKTRPKALIPKQAHQVHLVEKINPRLNNILALLRMRGKHTAKTLGRELGLSPATIRRAIKRLGDEQGISIPYDQVNNTYRLTETILNHPHLVHVPFTESEMRVALLGAKALLTCPETGLGQKALKYYEKISALMPKTWKNKKRDDDEIVSFGFTSKPIYTRGVLKKLIEMKEGRRQARILYATGDKKASWRVVEPYDVRLVNEMYYLIAYCHQRGEKATFCATRIKGIKETGETYEIPKTYNLKQFLKGNFGIVGGGKKSYNIVIRFQQERSYLVLERKWSGERKRVILPNRVVEMHFRLRSLWEFERWLKGHPGRFEVLEPLELRKSIGDAGLTMHLDNKVK